MAGPSISNIAVNVGMNSAGLQKGAQQAAQAVKSFTAQTSSGLGGVNTVAQQATFAVDDFMAAFHTGGVAGGLRGAANNLTMIAMSLGGIKAQLLVIAALSAGQFLAKMFSGGKKNAEELSKEVSKIADAMTRVREARESRISVIDEILGEGAGQRPADAARRLNEIRRGVATSSGILGRLQADRQEVANRFIPGAAEGAEEVAAHFKAIRDEELKAIDEKIAAESRNLELLEAQEWAQSNVARRARETANAAKEVAASQKQLIDQNKLNQPFITGAMRGAMSGELVELDEQIASIRQKMLPSLSMADMFRMFPSASTMGSVGAVSTINASQFGAQNARSAGETLLRQQAQDIKRLRELEEKKNGLLEVIGL